MHKNTFHSVVPTLNPVASTLYHLQGFNLSNDILGGNAFYLNHHTKWYLTSADVFLLMYFAFS